MTHSSFCCYLHRWHHLVEWLIWLSDDWFGSQYHTENFSCCIKWWGLALEFMHQQLKWWDNQYWDLWRGIALESILVIWSCLCLSFKFEFRVRFYWRANLFRNSEECQLRLWRIAISVLFACSVILRLCFVWLLYLFVINEGWPPPCMQG